MYKTIGSIFEKFVPLFSKVLTDLLSPQTIKIPIDSDWYEERNDENEDDDDYYSFENRTFKPITVPKFEAPAPKEICKINNLIRIVINK